MADALYSADDYKEVLKALLPPGRAWPRELGTFQDLVMGGLAPTFERLDARAQTLLVDAFPGSTVELLPEWEATLGLPDPCEGEAQGLEQRRAQVVARLVNAGGQSIPYFLGVLARLGYTDATISQYAPFRADVDHADYPVYSSAWAFAWNINLPELRVFYFQADISSVGEALVTISDTAVFCTIDALKPAHTIVSYSSDGLPPAGDLDFDEAGNPFITVI